MSLLALHSACRGLLRLGALPSPATLTQMQRQGYRDWLNLSGTDLYQIYPHLGLSGNQYLYQFPDIFSPAPALAVGQAPEQVSPALYAQASDVQSRRAFSQAVQQQISLWQQRRPVFLFCYQGRGRSPCVALTALHCAQNWSLTSLSHALRHQHPSACFTQLSYSAACWYREHSTESTFS